MTRLLATTSLLALLLAGPAAAQTRSPAVPPANPGMAAPESADPQQLNVSDRTFIQAAAWGGMAEVEFGKLAQQKARSDAVKAFAKRMVEDHSKANDRLEALAKQHDVGLPKELDADHRAVREHLEQLSGAAFDHAYIRGQVQDHQKTAHLLEYEIGNGQNARLRSFAAETLPTIFDHLRMAQELDMQLSIQAAQTAAKPEAAPADRTAPERREGGAGEKAGAREPERRQQQSR